MSTKSPNPVHNVTRPNDPVACDILYAGTPAMTADGSASAIIFVGVVDTHVNDVCVIKTDKQFVNTIEDNIIQCGAPNNLVSDCA